MPQKAQPAHRLVAVARLDMPGTAAPGPITTVAISLPPLALAVAVAAVD
jgi:hypothetical protein